MISHILELLRVFGNQPIIISKKEQRYESAIGEEAHPCAAAIGEHVVRRGAVLFERPAAAPEHVHFWVPAARVEVVDDHAFWFCRHQQWQRRGRPWHLRRGKVGRRPRRAPCRALPLPPTEPHENHTVIVDTPLQAPLKTPLKKIDHPVAVPKSDTFLVC